MLRKLNREFESNLLRQPVSLFRTDGSRGRSSVATEAIERCQDRSYCAHRKCVRIVAPKAHGLIFFAPSEERENRLPKWWWELWRFLLALEFKQIIQPDFNVLMVAERVINAETATDDDSQPSWLALPAMMKMRMSTPHYLDQMKGKASPFGFVLHPRTREKLKLTLLTPFSKNRTGWAHSVCINTHDGKRYCLDELSRANIVTLGDILCGYVQHPEIKSLAGRREMQVSYARVVAPDDDQWRPIALHWKRGFAV